MHPEIVTLYSEEGKVQVEIEESIKKRPTKRLSVISQVVMGLPSRTGAKAIVTTLVFVDV